MLLGIILGQQPMPSISLHCDSQATMSKAFSKIFNGKSRYISLRHRPCNNLVDLFIKNLSRNLVRSTSASISLRPFN
jgi:hypothetical protein